MSTSTTTGMSTAMSTSMSTSSTVLPQNRSRTSTQAIRVPMTTLTRVTSAAWPMVSRSAAAVCGLVRVAQTFAHPPPAAAPTMAARGPLTGGPTP